MKLTNQGGGEALVDLLGVLDYKGNGCLTLDEFFRVYKEFYSDSEDQLEDMSSLLPICNEWEEDSLSILLNSCGLQGLIRPKDNEILNSWRVLKGDEDTRASFEAFLRKIISEIPKEKIGIESVREDIKLRIQFRAKKLVALTSLNQDAALGDPMCLQQELLTKEAQLKAEMAHVDKLGNQLLDIQSSVPTNYLDEIRLLQEETQVLDALDSAHWRLEDLYLIIKAIKVRLQRSTDASKPTGTKDKSSPPSHSKEMNRINIFSLDHPQKSSLYSSTLSVRTKEPPVLTHQDSDGFEEVDIRRLSQDKGLLGKNELTPKRVFKVVFVGDATVGKTSLINRLCTGSFFPNTISTVGVDYRTRNVLVDNAINACVQFWDTAGQERYRSITRQYFRKTDAVVIVYDISDEKSFLNIRGWLTDAREGAGKESVILLLGNKLDLQETSRKVSFTEGQHLSHQFEAGFQEVSALSGRGVEAMLIQLVQLLWERRDFQIESELKLDLRRSIPRLNCCSSS